MKKLFVLAGVLLLAASPAKAAITIGALSQLCGYDANGQEMAPSAHASCQSYIAGIIDYNDLFKSVGKTAPNVDFCLPPALTYADLQRIILEFLQKNKNHADSPASAAVVLALRNEFPCDSGFGIPDSEGQVPGANMNVVPDVTTGDVLNTPAL